MEPQEPSTPPPPPPSYATTDDERYWAMLAHITPIAGWLAYTLAGWINFVPALAIWRAKHDRSAYVTLHAKQALNWQLTMLVPWFVAALLPHLGCVFDLLFVPVALVNSVYAIIAGVRALDGHYYSYPFALPFVR